MIQQASYLFLESFPGVIDTVKNLFENLPKELKILRIKESAEVFIAKGMVISLLVFTFFICLFSILLSTITKNVIFSTSISLLSSSIAAFLFFLIYIKLPSLKIQNLAYSLEKELHESLYTFSIFVNDKTPLNVSINNFVKSNPHYKLSKELNDILKLMEIGGMDIISAIDKKIETSFSNKLSRFLFGLSTTLRSGGSVKSYVSLFARDEIEEYRNKIRDAGRKASLLIQIYLIALVIGGMFINIIISIFSLIQPIAGIAEIQFFISFIMIPAISFMMVKLIRSIII